MCVCVSVRMCTTNFPFRNMVSWHSQKPCSTPDSKLVSPDYTVFRIEKF